MTNNDSKYTDPELRTEIKENIQASDKGGNPGQWSARKAQMMASGYKKAMEERGEEPYTTGKSQKDDRQKHLTEWTEEEWQTSVGKAEARRADGTEQRYLPKDAWEKMSDEVKGETIRAKLEGGAQGKQQRVPNDDAAKEARKEAANEPKNMGNKEDEYPVEKTEDEKSGKGISKRDRSDDEMVEVDEHSTPEDASESSTDERDARKFPPTKKSKANDGNGRQVGKRTGHLKNKGGDDQRGEPGSVDRLPEKGQNVKWRASTGWCEGTVLEILHEEKVVAGRKAKATANDPRIVLKSSKSGKSAVHKPGAVYF